MRRSCAEASTGFMATWAYTPQVLRLGTWLGQVREQNGAIGPVDSSQMGQLAGRPHAASATGWQSMVRGQTGRARVTAGEWVAIQLTLQCRRRSPPRKLTESVGGFLQLATGRACRINCFFESPQSSDK